MNVENYDDLYKYLKTTYPDYNYSKQDANIIYQCDFEHSDKSVDKILSIIVDKWISLSLRSFGNLLSGLDFKYIEPWLNEDKCKDLTEDNIEEQLMHDNELLDIPVSTKVFQDKLNELMTGHWYVTDDGDLLVNMDVL